MLNTIRRGVTLRGVRLASLRILGGMPHPPLPPSSPPPPASHPHPSASPARRIAENQQGHPRTARPAQSAHLHPPRYLYAARFIFRTEKRPDDTMPGRDWREVRVVRRRRRRAVALRVCSGGLSISLNTFRARTHVRWWTTGRRCCYCWLSSPLREVSNFSAQWLHRRLCAHILRAFTGPTPPRVRASSGDSN